PVEQIQIQETIHPPVPVASEPQDQKSSSKNILPLICQQLLKIKKDNEENSDTQILITIIGLLSDNNEEEIKNIVKDLRGKTQNGDTENLINQYLNENK